MQLYKRLCLSLRPLVRPSIHGDQVEKCENVHWWCCSYDCFCVLVSMGLGGAWMGLYAPAQPFRSDIVTLNVSLWPYITCYHMARRPVFLCWWILWFMYQSCWLKCELDPLIYEIFSTASLLHFSLLLLPIGQEQCSNIKTAQKR